MALFKVFKGGSAQLNNQTKVDGYCWFTYDNGKFYIDYKINPNDDDEEVKRQPLNAEQADKDSLGYLIQSTYAAELDLSGHTLQLLAKDGTNLGNAITLPDTTYTFASGTNGSFTVTPTGGQAQIVSIGKPAVAGTADSVAWTGITNKPTSYNPQKAADNVLGGIKTGYSESGKNYAVKVDGNGNAYVYVPWMNSTYTFDGTYNASTNKVATVSTVTNAINALDVTTIAGFGTGKTLKTLTETDGKISATFQDIAITKDQISGLPTNLSEFINDSGFTSNTGTVTSVRVQATGPIQSSQNVAQSETLDTTISLADASANTVLAGPSFGSAAAPDFRSLVADDIPSLSISKISDFPDVTNVKQKDDASNNANYRLLLSNSDNDIEEDSISRKNANLTFNPSTNKLSTINLDLTGELDVVGNAYLHNQTVADSLSAGSLIVTGNANFTNFPTAPTATVGDKTNKLATTEFVSNSVAGLSGAMHFKGTTTTEIISGSITNPITIGDNSYTAEAGDVVLREISTGNIFEYVWTGSVWEMLGRDTSFKVTQDPVSDPTASGSTTAFIDTISQDADGVITVTKRNLDTSGTWSGNAATATELNSTGTTAKFWRGDNKWSNILEQTVEIPLGINTSSSQIGKSIKTLHIATSDVGSGTGVADGQAAGLTFGITNGAYAGIYYQSSSSYGSRLYFATTNSFGYGAFARMMITHDGKVGIGTTSPSTLLHVAGDVTIEGLDASLAVSTNAEKKLVSTNLAVSDPDASGTGIEYIASISQSAVGQITATKSTVRTASTSQTGVIQITTDNANNFLNQLSTGSSTPQDTDYYISQFAGGGTTTTTYHRRPMSALWSYINGKITDNRITTATQYGVAYYSSTTKITSTAQGAANTALMGNGAAAPAFVAVGTTLATSTAATASAAQKLKVTVLGVASSEVALTTATTGRYGVTKLSSSTSDTSTTTAATPSAVKAAYDLANEHKYWANVEATSAASYNTTPEVASIKIGNGTATATGAKGATLQYDSTLEVLNFVFS